MTNSPVSWSLRIGLIGLGLSSLIAFKSQNHGLYSVFRPHHSVEGRFSREDLLPRLVPLCRSLLPRSMGHAPRQNHRSGCD